MTLSTDEQEIHLSKGRNEDCYEVYITDRTKKTKIEKAKVKPYKVDKDEETGEEVAWYYRLHDKQVSFRILNENKRKLTEEERQKARDRAQNMIKNRKNKNNNNE